MDNNCNENINAETVTELNAQHDAREIRDIREQKPCIHDEVRGTGGADSSLLFFFLLLVVIVSQCDIDISMDTLLWFFLLLVVLFNEFD